MGLSGDGGREEKENKKHWGRGRKGIGEEEERKRKSGKEESKRDAKVSEVFPSPPLVRDVT